MSKAQTFFIKWLKRLTKSRKKRSRNKISRNLRIHHLQLRFKKKTRTRLKTRIRLDNLRKIKMLIDHQLPILMKVMKLWSMKLMSKQSRCKVDLVLINSKNKKISSKQTTRTKLCTQTKTSKTTSTSKTVLSPPRKRTTSKRPTPKPPSKTNPLP